MNRILGISLLGAHILLFLYLVTSDYYPPLLIWLHALSILAVWGWIFRSLDIRSLIRKHRADAIWIGIIFAVALFIRLYQVEEITPGMYGDEVSIGRYSVETLERSEMLPFVGAYSHATPRLYLTGYSMELFGRTLTALRLPSILAGAFHVIIFYLLLRNFFPRAIAILGGFIMSVTYTHVVLSRLAYEAVPSLLFQTLALLFLTLAYKTKKFYYLVGLGLSLAGGMYTYLNFRIFVVVVFVLAFFCLGKFTQLRDKFQQVGIVLLVFFIGTVPLFSYSIRHSAEFWGRSAKISIFQSGLSQEELVKELGGNISRTLGMFVHIGDPNAAKNPAKVSFFDPLTILFLYIGVFYLFKRDRRLFLLCGILIGSSLVSDVFSLERIPEFHYYGLGHPNTLRVSGAIPVVIFLVCVALDTIRSRTLKHKEYQTYYHLTIFLVTILCLVNLHWYFNQRSVSPLYYFYNYQVNHVPKLRVIEAINTSPSTSISLPSEIASSAHAIFFIKPDKKISSFEPTSSADILEQIEKTQLTYLGLNQSNHAHAEEALQKIQTESLPIRTEILFDPRGFAETIIFTRN